MLVKTNRKGQRQVRRGFTLIEVLLVVGILVALAAIAVPQLIGVAEGSKVDQAKIQVKNIENALNLFNTHTMNFPANNEGLIALESPNPMPNNWRGPYLKVTNMTDPWGNAYNYNYPGTHSVTGPGLPAPPDIWSNGPDKQSGTNDDIGNWISK